jgi:hypothetical protein
MKAAVIIISDVTDLISNTLIKVEHCQMLFSRVVLAVSGILGKML